MEQQVIFHEGNHTIEFPPEIFVALRLWTPLLLY
jgi:hypothetical protein